MKLAAAAFAAALLSAQTPQPGGSIEGMLTDAVTGAPLADVVVSTNRNETVRSDDKGHYLFRNLGPGYYQILVIRNAGYANRSANVRLVAGQEVKGIDLKLDREAILAGRVLDRDKNPVARATVTRRGYGYRDGRPTLTSFHSVVTNDLGEFRFTGIAPGRYYVEVDTRPLTVRKLLPDDAPAEREPVLGNVRTYYPNSTRFEGASPLTFTAGQQMEGLDIVLPRDKTYCLTSSLAGAGVPGERYGVQLSEPMPMSQSRIASGSVEAGDRFEICGIPAGPYRLSAYSTNNLRYAVEPVAVTNRAVEAPPLMLAQAIKLAGTLTVDGARPEDPVPAGLHVSLEPKDRIRVAGETTDAVVEPSGAFVLPGVLLDEYWLEVRGLRPGYYIKQATVNGRDVLREPLRTGQGDLSIVLGSDGPTLSGTVNTADNQPIPNAVVLLAVFPLPDYLGWGDIRAAFADQNGFFSFPTGPPGSYRLLAFASLPDGAAYDPELVRSNLAKSVELNLAPKEKKTLTVVP